MGVCGAGNVVIDTLLCCLVPLIVSLVFSNLVHLKTFWDNTAWPWLYDLILGRNRKPLKPQYTRTLVNRRNQNMYYGGAQQDKTRQLMTVRLVYVWVLGCNWRGSAYGATHVWRGVCPCLYIPIATCLHMIPGHLSVHQDAGQVLPPSRRVARGRGGERAVLLLLQREWWW